VKEASEYKYYTVRLRRPLLGLLPGRLWAKWVTHLDYTDYTRNWLVQHFGDQWPRKLLDARHSEAFEIHGRDSKEAEWEPLSGWLIRHENRLNMMARWWGVESEAEAPRRQPGRPAGSGIGVLVRHLRDVEGLTNYDELLVALRECGLESVVETVDGWGKDARSKLPKVYAENVKRHKERCPYCKRGLPPSLKATIGTPH